MHKKVSRNRTRGDYVDNKSSKILVTRSEEEVSPDADTDIELTPEQVLVAKNFYDSNSDEIVDNFDKHFLEATVDHQSYIQTTGRWP